MDRSEVMEVAEGTLEAMMESLINLFSFMIKSQYSCMVNVLI